MPYLTWTDELNTGIRIIDEEHKVLLGLLNTLYDAIHEGHAAEVLCQTIEGMILYAVTHFEHEEEYMLATNYPGLNEHKAEHEQLRLRVMALHAKAATGSSDELSNEILSFLKSWVRGHLMFCDKAFVPHLLAHGAR